MVERALIELIKSEITQSCSLPYSLPDPEVKRIIDRAKEWFWTNYEFAVEDRVLPIPLEVFQHPNFLATRTIQLPSCVVAVYELKEANGSGIFGNPDRDFSDSKLLGGEVFLNAGLEGGEALMFRTALYSYYSLARAYSLETIAYRYNRNTKRITVLGRASYRNCFVRAGVKIPDESLFDDELFVRYCFAQAKINLGRILSIFQFQLPGAVSINFNETKADGIQELLEIKEQIDKESPGNNFLQWE